LEQIDILFATLHDDLPEGIFIIETLMEYLQYNNRIGFFKSHINIEICG